MRLVALVACLSLGPVLQGEAMPSLEQLVDSKTNPFRPAGYREPVIEKPVAPIVAPPPPVMLGQQLELRGTTKSGDKTVVLVYDRQYQGFGGQQGRTFALVPGEAPRADYRINYRVNKLNENPDPKKMTVEFITDSGHTETLAFVDANAAARQVAARQNIQARVNQNLQRPMAPGTMAASGPLPSASNGIRATPPPTPAPTTAGLITVNTPLSAGGGISAAAEAQQAAATQQEQATGTEAKPQRRRIMRRPPPAPGNVQPTTPNPAAPPPGAPPIPLPPGS